MRRRLRSTMSRSITGTGVSTSPTGTGSAMRDHGDAIDLHQNAVQLATDRSARRGFAREELGIDRVPFPEARNVAQVAVDLDDFAEAAARALQDGAEIGERLPHLGPEIIRHAARLGIDRALARDEDEAIGHHRV